MKLLGKVPAEIHVSCFPSDISEYYAESFIDSNSHNIVLYVIVDTHDLISYRHR
jgi:hypothetical protein